MTIFYKKSSSIRIFYLPVFVVAIFARVATFTLFGLVDLVAQIDTRGEYAAQLDVGGVVLHSADKYLTYFKKSKKNVRDLICAPHHVKNQYSAFVMLLPSSLAKS